MGSKAVAKGFTYLKENPELKDAVVKELSDSLKLGFEKAKENYPILQTLQPRYIVSGQKGRIAQAKAMVGEIEKKEQENMLESNKNLGKTMNLKDRLLLDDKIKYAYLRKYRRTYLRLYRKRIF